MQFDFIAIFLQVYNNHLNRYNDFNDSTLCQRTAHVDDDKGESVMGNGEENGVEGGKS